MPSSFATAHSSTLGYSPRPPVSVYGTVALQARLEDFLGSLGARHFMGLSPSPSRLGIEDPDLPRSSPYTLRPARPSAGCPSLLRPPFAQTLTQRYRNVRLFSIAYAFRPRLRDRLTLGGLTFPRKPQAFGEQVSRLLYRYLCQHDHFHFVHPFSRTSFDLPWNAPLPPPRTEVLDDPQLRHQA